MKNLLKTLKYNKSNLAYFIKILEIFFYIFNIFIFILLLILFILILFGNILYLDVNLDILIETTKGVKDAINNIILNITSDSNAVASNSNSNITSDNNVVPNNNFDPSNPNRFRPSTYIDFTFHDNMILPDNPYPNLYFYTTDLNIMIGLQQLVNNTPMTYDQIGELNRFNSLEWFVVENTERFIREGIPLDRGFINPYLIPENLVRFSRYARYTWDSPDGPYGPEGIYTHYRVLYRSAQYRWPQ